jgi:membrane anchored protein
MMRTRKILSLAGLLVLAASLLVFLSSAAFGAARDPYSHGKPHKRPKPPIESPPNWVAPAEAPAPGVPAEVEGNIQGRPLVLREEVAPGNIPGAPPPQVPGVLPFTGADLALYAATGLAALTTGVTLVKLGSRRKNEADDS